MGLSIFQKFDSSGVFLSKWGNYGIGDGQFSNPYDIVVDGGSIYVVDQGNQRIQKFDASNESVVVMMGEDGSPPAFGSIFTASDPDGDSLTWSLRSQASHGVADASGIGASKIISYTPAAHYNGSDSFIVKVADGQDGEDTITVNVTIEPVNDIPTANAGPDQQARAGSLITLDGSGSSDPDGDSLTYGWSQAGGPLVTLSDPALAGPTFTAPNHTTMLTFTLTVTDPFGLVSPMPTEVVITVDKLVYYVPLIIK